MNTFCGLFGGVHFGGLIPSDIQDRCIFFQVFTYTSFLNLWESRLTSSFSGIFFNPFWWPYYTGTKPQVALVVKNPPASAGDV